MAKRNAKKRKKYSRGNVTTRIFIRRKNGTEKKYV
jgi:hypothetical protein